MILIKMTTLNTHGKCIHEDNWKFEHRLEVTKFELKEMDVKEENQMSLDDIKVECDTDKFEEDSKKDIGSVCLNNIETLPFENLDDTGHKVIVEDAIVCGNIKVEQELYKTDDSTADNEMKIEEIYISGDIEKDSNSYCENCREEFQDYCNKCPMLSFILDSSVGTRVLDRAKKTVPKNILEVRESSAAIGIFTLKIIPKNVKFGPFIGLDFVSNATGISWKLKGGKFILNPKQKKYSNWMQYVNHAKHISEQNLNIFQYENNLYYQSVRDINVGEQLLLYFGEEYVENLNSNVEKYYHPVVVDKMDNVYACTFCCLGFTSEVHLANHKIACPDGTTINSSYEGIIQCPYCKIYLNEDEYSNYHVEYCCEKSVRQCEVPSQPDPSKEHAPERHKCPKCDYRTDGLRDLRRHLHAHHLTEVFECPVCARKFSRKSSLTFHMKYVHVGDDGEKKYKSPVCDFQTNVKREMMKHLKLHGDADYACSFKSDGDRRYQCTRCSYETNRKWDFAEHNRSHSDPQPYTCPECSFETKYSTSLQRHLRTHNVEKRATTDSVKKYKCSKCRYETKRKNYMREHMYRHSVLKLYECGKCPFRTNDRRYLRRHVNNHEKVENLTCGECGREFSKKNCLVLHVKNKHNPNNAKEFKCDSCSYETDRKDFLRKHSCSGGAVKQYQCSLCSHKSNKKSNMKRHMETHNDTKRYQCSACSFKTSNKGSLRLHAKNKHGPGAVKHFKCDKCSYETNRRDSLRGHLCLGSEVRRYQCSQCPHESNSKSNMKRHMETHNDTKRYQCSTCSFKTSNKYCLTKHFRKLHGTLACD